MQAVDIETGNVAQGAPFTVDYCYLHAAEAFEQGHLYNRANIDERRKRALQGDSDALTREPAPMPHDPDWALPFDRDNGIGKYERPDQTALCKVCRHARAEHPIGLGCHVEPKPGYVCGCREFRE